MFPISNNHGRVMSIHVSGSKIVTFSPIFAPDFLICSTYHSDFPRYPYIIFNLIFFNSSFIFDNILCTLLNYISDQKHFYFPQFSFLIITKGADNVIIGANSLINKDIPSNSVVAGNPAKVIGSLDDYHKKRLSLQFEEAKELAKAYKAATGLIPPQHVFREFVFLFRNEEDEYGKLIEKSYEEILHINGNYNKTIETYKKRKPMFNSYEDFITASLKE